MNFNLERLAGEISKSLDNELSKIGILYRLFWRAKEEESIQKKQEIKKYSENGDAKKMQDIIGVRITLYFADDVELVRGIIKEKFEFVDETIDKTETTQFKPTRINLIFRLNENSTIELNETAQKNYQFIDNTYEVQIRTVLSEGWHEVDHDLRYKCQSDWDDQEDLQRAFNGVFAGLETSDWSTLMIFEKLSYRHYKNSNWHAMLRTKFRLRLRDDLIGVELIQLLNTDGELSKKLFRIERDKFLQEIISRDIKIPFTLSNLIFLSNCFYIGHEEIFKHTPQPLLEDKAINRLAITKI